MEEQLLKGKDEIAEYVGVSWPTAKRFIEKGGLPAMRLGKRWYAAPSAIDAWKVDQLSYRGAKKVKA